MTKLVLMNADTRSLYAAPPINLAMIASYLEKNLDFHDIKIIDVNFVKNYVEKLIDLNPDIVGISSTTLDFEKAAEMARIIKKRLNAPILIGGAHISLLPSCLKGCFDIGVIGEGEETMLELMKLWLNKKNFAQEELKKIKGLVFHKGKKLFFTEPRPSIEDMSTIPVYDKKYIDKRHFGKKFVAGGYYRYYNILTMRGCPYNCAFCSIAAMCNRKVRYVPIKDVVDEIEELVNKHHIQFINICDGTFNLNKQRIKEITEEMRKRKILGKVKFGSTARANIFDEECCKLLKDMGFVMVGFGFESGSPNMIKYLKKNVTLEQNQQAIILAKKYGFITMGSLILGSPGETIEDMKKTIDFVKFAKKHKCDMLWVRVMTPFPGTEIWDIAKERGKVRDDMNFEILSQENVGNPMLLDNDILLEEFKKLFYECRKEMSSMRTKTAVRYFLKHPVGISMEMLKKPLPYLKVAKQIFINKNKYNVAYEEDRYANANK
jgi:anaerobic magnesium-protoporphyrin IX monomethyl ester cyclase